MTCRTMLLAAFAVLALAPAVLAQEDAEGTKDTPYFTRMPGWHLTESKDVDFDAYTFLDGKALVRVEGHLYQAVYQRNEDGATTTSPLQVKRNYVQAIKSMGGSIVFDGRCTICDSDTRGSSENSAWGKVVRGQSELWVEIMPFADEYWITVVEKEAMKQDVTANDMLKALEKDGRIALSINFDTGKATIRPESKPIVDQIVELLRQNASLKVAVEGHTDNVGAADANRKLSNDRARAVVAAVVAAGIDAGRLSAAGFGAERPVADNATEDGRAKNRRVEIVKK